ncbi:hypothetical protein [Fusobacterium pseudoperiodonticum]|nr:hypothetical protein [Fusobacterium pseudoperiodonticum]
MDIKIEETEDSLKIIKYISILEMKLKNIMVGDMKYLWRKQKKLKRR